MPKVFLNIGLILILIKVGYTGELDSDKILLNEILLGENETEFIDKFESELVRLLFLQLFDANMPIVAVLPIVENSSNNNLNLLLEDVNSLVAFLMSQNSQIGLLSPSDIKKLLDRKNFTEDIFNAVTKL